MSSVILTLTMLIGMPMMHLYGQIEALPASINTPAASEGFPVISADGKTLYFARTRTGLDGSLITDIWKSEIDGNGRFLDPQLMQGSLRSRYGIVLVSVSPDNNTLYCVGKPTANTPPEDRVFYFRRTADGWSQPNTIHIRQLKQKSTTTDYCFGPNQKTLIMALERDTTAGGMDLYVSFLDESANEWTIPKWLGSTINSPSNEVTPFLAADGKTLFFSRDRSGGSGELDVYSSTRLDESWARWTIPKRVDIPGIIRGRSSYFSIDASGVYAYFVWRPDAYSTTDIYRYRLQHTEARALLLKGKITDETGKTLEALIRYERLDSAIDVGIAHSHPVTGEYSIVLPYGVKYGIYAERKGYYPVSEFVSTTTDDTISVLQKDLVLTALKEDAPIRLNNIFFETDKAELLPESKAELDRLVKFLRDQPTVSIALEGHTDSTGSRAHNLALSLSRADAIKSYLVTAGIGQERLRTVGYGPDKPATVNTTEEGRALNRRVEFRIEAH